MTRNIIIFLSILIFTGNLAHAGEVLPNEMQPIVPSVGPVGCYAKPHEFSPVPESVSESCRAAIVADPCLTMMEAAMRAMDPWIIREFHAIDTQTIEIRKRLSAEQYAVSAQARTQWELAKWACWRKP